MIPVLLAVAAIALYVLPLIVPKPPPPDEVALPPLGPSVTPPPPGPDFVGAVRAVDSVIAYLRGTGQYAGPQVDAARVLRAAVVEGATPPPENAVWMRAAIERKRAAVDGATPGPEITKEVS